MTQGHIDKNSDKLFSTGFIQKYFVNDAIDEIIEKFNNKELEDKEEHYTIKMMKKILSQESQKI